MDASVYDDRRADDLERAEELRRRKYVNVTYRRFRDLTVEQAEFVLKTYPANTDPWLYEYELTGERVSDRYMLARAK